MDQCSRIFDTDIAPHQATLNLKKNLVESGGQSKTEL